MRKFVYQNENEQVHLEMQDMDLIQAAAEIGSIAQEVYSAVYRQEPAAAEQFKMAFILSAVHPDSPIWKPKEHSENAIEMCIIGKKHK
jgi:hypothetical protein